MDDYTKNAISELVAWQREMLRRPSLLKKISKRLQTKMNNWIPEKVHAVITATIRQMIRAVLFGSTYTTAKPLLNKTFEIRETAIRERIRTYKNTAAIEGGVTGAGGILLGLADFPILLAIKLKLLFDIASLYGFDVKDYKERVYILYIFQLAFSSHQHRKETYLKMVNWDEQSKKLPDSLETFDWRSLQQEYRDYIDLAKMAQLIPFIGAPVGYIANSRLIRTLGITAMNAYRMRRLKEDVQVLIPASNP
jgi:hypothetical protein